MTAVVVPGPEHGSAVFQIHDVTKIYWMGDVEVHALRGSIWICMLANSSWYSVHPEVANPRCSMYSEGWMFPRAEKFTTSTTISRPQVMPLLHVSGVSMWASFSSSIT